MTEDPLAQFRKTPVTPKDGLIGSPQQPEGYVAFGTKDKVRRLRIRCNSDMVRSPGYNILLDVVSDGQLGTYCILVYTIIVVKVQGKNLHKMVFAIENGMADFIESFDADRWQKPKDDKAAFIESIEVKVLGGALADETQH